MSLSSAYESLYQEDLYKVPSRVVIVLGKNWEDTTEEDKTLLSKILASVKLGLSAVQILTKADFTIEDLAALSPSKTIVFGATLKTSHNTYQNLSLQGISVIVADALDKLDDAKKKSLWLALRQMFGI